MSPLPEYPRRVKSKPLRSRKIARSTPLWFPRSLGAMKLKRVLYFMRYPRGGPVLNKIWHRD